MKTLLLAWCWIFFLHSSNGYAEQAGLTTTKVNEVTTMDEKPKRGAPKPVTPLEINGVRYEVLRNPKARGFRQDGGVIVAVDMTTGLELWTLIVYQTAYDEKEERDVQELYITKLIQGADENSLLVENEARKTYLLNIRTREVSQVAGQ